MLHPVEQLPRNDSQPVMPMISSGLRFRASASLKTRSASVRPSDIARIPLAWKSVGICVTWVCNWAKTVSTVACLVAARLNSVTVRGRQLGKAIYEGNHVRTSVASAIDHGELVRHRPVIVVRFRKIELPESLAPDRTFLGRDLHFSPVGLHPVDPAVPFNKAERFRMEKPAQPRLDHIKGPRRVQQR